VGGLQRQFSAHWLAAGANSQWNGRCGTIEHEDAQRLPECYGLGRWSVRMGGEKTLEILWNERLFLALIALKQTVR